MKTCTKCLKKRKISSFGKESKASDGLRSTCKKCDQKHRKEWYKNNRDKHIQIVKKSLHARKTVLRGIVVEYLENHPCIDCGEPDLVVLEFDHVTGVKRKDVSSLLRMTCSPETLLNEIAKCEVRCANCHRRKTARQFKYNTSWVNRT